MATHRVEILTRASAEAAWDAIRDVGALHTRLVPGFVVDTQLEPIVAVDEARRRLVWSAIGGATTHYNASAEVVSDAGRTRVVWTADFLPDEAGATIRALMARGAEVMRETQIPASELPPVRLRRRRRRRRGTDRGGGRQAGTAAVSRRCPARRNVPRSVRKSRGNLERELRWARCSR